MKTLLITAYAINPYKGSEDGTGWNLVRQTAKKYKVILVTRKNNVPHLDKYFAEHPGEGKNIEYMGFDLSDFVLRLKKRSGSKGHVIYFYLWQKRIVKFIKGLNMDFDAAWSLNFHSDSHPHFLWKLKKPTIWGPIGHHSKVPKEFILKPYGIKSFVIDRLFAWSKIAMRRLNPAFRKAIRETEQIFVINSSISKVIRSSPQKTTLLPAVASPSQEKTSEPTGASFSVLCVGRFHFLKGFDITLKSFAAFLENVRKEDRGDVKLTMVGKGKLKEQLRQTSKELGIEGHVEWVDWVDHAEMDQLYRQADLFLFPSHEGAGMVVPEAMSYGLPVLTFDNYGPGELVALDALKVPYESYKASIRGFANKLSWFFSNRKQLEYFGEVMRKRQQEKLTWDYKGSIVRKELSRILKSA